MLSIIHCPSDCRSTYDFRPPFKVYTTIEEDRDTANKVMPAVTSDHLVLHVHAHMPTDCDVSFMLQTGQFMLSVFIHHTKFAPHCRRSSSSSCEQTLGQTKPQQVSRWWSLCPERCSASAVSMSRMCNPLAIRPGIGKRSNIALFGSTRR